MPALSLERCRLTWTTSALIALASAALLITEPGEGGVRAVIRLTARSSLLLFVLAFSAAALARFLPGPFTRWQLRNRRYLGLGFAASHGLHALALVSFALWHPASFAEHTRSMPIGPGLVAYGFIVAMAATSTDGAVRWLGQRRWRALHVVGSLYVWAAFFKAVLTRTPRSPGYWLPVALLTCALLLRLAHWALSARAAGAVSSRR